MEKIDGELEEENKHLNDVLKLKGESDLELDARKKEQASYLKEIAHGEKKISKKKTELDKKVSFLFLYIFVVTHFHEHFNTLMSSIMFILIAMKSNPLKCLV